MMPVKTLTIRQRKIIAFVAFVLVVLLAGDVFYQFGIHVAWRRWIPEAVADSPTTRPADTQPATAPAVDDNGAMDSKPKPHEVYKAITKRNVFSPHRVAKHGLRLTGVLGRVALFAKGDQTIGIELGRSEQGVKVVKIDGYEVTIEYQGKEETMKLFSDMPGKNEPSPRPSEPEARLVERKDSEESRSGVVPDLSPRSDATDHERAVGHLRASGTTMRLKVNKEGSTSDGNQVIEVQIEPVIEPAGP